MSVYIQVWASLTYSVHDFPALSLPTPFTFFFLFQFGSVAQSCPALIDPMDCMQHTRLPCPSPTPGVYSNSCPSSHWQPSHPLSSLLLLPSVFASIRVFSNESVLRIRWTKYCSFSFSISPSNEYSGLISFRKDWLDLLAAQGTCKSLL